MKGRQARGCGGSAQETTKTIAKKAANSIVGKTTKGFPPPAEASSSDSHDSHACPRRNSRDRGGRRRARRRLRRAGGGRAGRPVMEHLRRPLLPGAAAEAR